MRRESFNNDCSNFFSGCFDTGCKQFRHKNHSCGAKFFSSERRNLLCHIISEIGATETTFFALVLILNIELKALLLA